MSLSVLAAAFALGTALGAAHFASLRWSVNFICGGRPSLGMAAQALRFAALAAALVVITRCGTGPFLAAVGGLLAARALLIRRLRSAA